MPPNTAKGPRNVFFGGSDERLRALLPGDVIRRTHDFGPVHGSEPLFEGEDPFQLNSCTNLNVT